ncbi:hypothetical protein FRC07_011389 [Ceratobasidium sp. 392]|nr:hypothetical protein FRC07_011389 [Ceratobasidium sp. 392]
MPGRVRSPVTESDDSGDEASKTTYAKKQKTKHKFPRAGAAEDESNPAPKEKKKKAGRATRSNKEHAADVLATVGEAGGDEADDESDEALESESSETYRPARDRMDTDDPEPGQAPQTEAEEEEDIVASLYEDQEGVGEDKLYKKLLLVVQDLVKDHKLLHEKIEKLTVRLERKEANARKAGGAGKTADEDVEMEPPATAPSKPSKSSKKKRTEWKQDVMDERPAGRRPQNPTRLLLLGYIRQTVLALLGRKSRKEMLPDGPPENISGPTETMFYIQWTESEKSTFNRIAANVVATKVIKEWPQLCSEDDRDSLHAMAIQHIRYLIKLYKRQRLPGDDPQEKIRRLRCSVDTRKRTVRPYSYNVLVLSADDLTFQLFEQRLKAVTVIPGIQKHRQLIIELGIQGTSSDEEDPNDRNHYLVNRRKEFSTELNELKQKIDYVYKTHYKTVGSKGSPVRQRAPSGKVSTRRFQIENLPRSIMSRKWLSTLTKNQIALHKFNDFEYNFSFPDELLKDTM